MLPVELWVKCLAVANIWWLVGLWIYEYSNVIQTKSAIASPWNIGKKKWAPPCYLIIALPLLQTINSDRPHFHLQSGVWERQGRSCVPATIFGAYSYSEGPRRGQHGMERATELAALSSRWTRRQTVLCILSSSKLMQITKTFSPGISQCAE
jgi:hypothetical protein